MKIVTVLGARPQFIKAAALSRILKTEPRIEEIIVHTGQHYDTNMNEVFFHELDIPNPQYNLQIQSKRHGEMTGLMLQQIESILLDEKPEMVLVYGDTNSTLAGALAAAKHNIQIAHVEAGLRSFNKKMPEEINRIVTDHISSFLFTPTDQAAINLKREGFSDTTIYPVGDVMLDGLIYYLKKVSDKPSVLEKYNLSNNEFILVTIHRAENTNDPERLEEIFSALESLSERYTLIMPLHPRTKAFLKKEYNRRSFRIIEPVGYFEMLLLQHHSRLLVTDSGGVQKEAYFHKKYCITLRDETEWVELVEHGFNFLAKPRTLIDLVDSLWSKRFEGNTQPLYGNGDATKKILEVIQHQL